MNFIKKLFSKIYDNTSSKANAMSAIPKKEYNWDMYTLWGSDDDKPVFISFNSEIAAEINDLPFYQCLSFRIKLKNPTENGLPQGDEWSVIHTIHDNINQYMNNKQYEQVGWLTTHGARIYYYYGIFDNEKINIFNSSLRDKFSYDIQYSLKEDLRKETYWDFLYPDDEGWQFVSNNRLLTSLQQKGDSLTLPRKIDHLIRFKDKKQRTEFSMWAVDNGFSLGEETECEDEDLDNDEDLPCKFEALIIHDDIPEKRYMNNVVLMLYRKAKECGGEYDGWGCCAVQDRDERQNK